MKLFRMSFLTTIAAVATMALFSPPPAAAAIVKEVYTFTIPEDAAVSNAAITGLDGIIRYARVVTPDDTATTVTIKSWNGPTIGEIELASASVVTEGASTISAFASVPIAGETRVTVTREEDVDADTTFYLVVLVER